MQADEWRHTLHGIGYPILHHKVCNFNLDHFGLRMLAIQTLESLTQRYRAPDDWPSGSSAAYRPRLYLTRRYGHRKTAANSARRKIVNKPHPGSSRCGSGKPDSARSNSKFSSIWSQVVLCWPFQTRIDWVWVERHWLGGLGVSNRLSPETIIATWPGIPNISMKRIWNTLKISKSRAYIR